MVSAVNPAGGSPLIVATYSAAEEYQKKWLENWQSGARIYSRPSMPPERYMISI